MDHFKFLLLDQNNKVESFGTSDTKLELPEGAPHTVVYTDHPELYQVGDLVSPTTGGIITPAPKKLEQEIPDYVKARKAAYPSVEDQLGMLWQAMEDNQTPRLEPFYSTIKAIKDANPKMPSIGTTGNLIL